MARGRHYAKLSLSNAARLSFSDLCILLFMFLSLCRLCVCVFLCSHWSLVDVPLIFFCPADHVPDWQPRVLLGMVEARSVNVKKTTTTTISCLPMVTKGLPFSPDSRQHSFFFFFPFSFISLIADGPHHYHPACGHKGSSHLSPVHALQFFIAMQVQHSYYNSSTNG